MSILSSIKPTNNCILGSSVESPTDAQDSSIAVNEPSKPNGVVSYNLVDDYGKVDESIQMSPGWCMAIIRLDKPLTYSRKSRGSVGDVVSGAYQRRDKPLIIFDDCIGLNIFRSADSTNYTKVLNATLKSGSTNYLSANAVLPGDWIFAWCHNDIEYTKNLISLILSNEPANKFHDGLKFVGRVHNIRKNISVNATSKNVTYTLQAVGFGELDATFYYNVQLGSAIAPGVNKNESGENNLAAYMSSIGINWTNYASKRTLSGNKYVDNIDSIMTSFIDIVVGEGGPKLINAPSTSNYGGIVQGRGVENGQLVEGGAKGSVGIPGAESAPYAYLIPVTAAQILGKNHIDKSKPSVFGYSDILHVLIGVQKYDSSTVTGPSRGFWPILEEPEKNRLSSNRSFCSQSIRGTYNPICEANFLNRPLWQILYQFLNTAINTMYTALKVGPDGNIMPTLVIRQIPFSTNCIKEEDFPLSRFLELPRWRADPVMIKELNVGRSDATRKNMVKITGDPSMYPNGTLQEPGIQDTLNPNIFDVLDIARGGLKPEVKVITCDPVDVVRMSPWIRAVADWTFGSQYTLNGTIKCTGIQSPIAEGDAFEFDGIVYFIETISDRCQVYNGRKMFETTLTLTNGMPADQSMQTGDTALDFPLYPGFEVLEKGKDSSVKGDDEVLRKYEPGITEDRDSSLNNEGA